MVGRAIGRGDARRLAMPEPMSFYVDGKYRKVGLVDLGATFKEE
jgi:hypothetical protein